MHRAHGVGLLAMTLGALVVCWPAAARGSTSVFHLEFTAPPGCPSEVTFRSQVRARTSKLDFSDVVTSAQRLTVSIAELESGFLGRLSLETAPGELAAREVQAQSCDEVVAALALTFALIVDPESGERGASTNAPSQRWSLGAQLALSGAPSSFPAPRVGAFADWFGPVGSINMGGRALVAYALGSEGSPQQGRTALSLLSARLSFCPLAKRWTVEPSLCVVGEVGALTARGQAVETPRSETTTWVAGGAELGLRFPARGVWFLGASGELLLPLVRHRFVLEDTTEIYAVPRVVAGASVSFGIRLP